MKSTWPSTPLWSASVEWVPPWNSLADPRNSPADWHPWIRSHPRLIVPLVSLSAPPPCDRNHARTANLTQPTQCHVFSANKEHQLQEFDSRLFQTRCRRTAEWLAGELRPAFPLEWPLHCPAHLHAYCLTYCVDFSSLCSAHHHKFVIIITISLFHTSSIVHNKSKVIWEKAESLSLLSIRQVAAAICNCEFWLGGGVRPQKIPLPVGVRDPHLTQLSLDPWSVPAKWHLNPLNGLSKVHDCDRRQTDHVKGKCVAIGYSGST